MRHTLYINYRIIEHLYISHSQSIFPSFSIFLLNLPNDWLDLTTAERLFHIKVPLK